MVSIKHTNGENLTYTYQYDRADRFSSLTLSGSTRIAVNQFQWSTPAKVSYPGGTQTDRQLDGLNQLKSLEVLDAAKNSILDH